jgi:hypothetical protein
MTQLAERSPDAEVRLHAIYETVTAPHPGQRRPTTRQPLVRAFIDDIQSSDNPTLPFNASVAR